MAERKEVEENDNAKKGLACFSPKFSFASNATATEDAGFFENGQKKNRGLLAVDQ